MQGKDAPGGLVGQDGPAGDKGERGLDGLPGAKGSRGMFDINRHLVKPVANAMSLILIICETEVLL